jgi:hypothetical protein
VVCANFGEYDLFKHNCQKYVQDLAGVIELLRHDAHKYYDEPKTTLDCVFGPSTSTYRAASAVIRGLLWPTSPPSPIVTGFDDLVGAVEKELKEGLVDGDWVLLDYRV